MIGARHEGIPYNRESILSEAARESGVYAIHNRQTWIYVGETADIQVRLLEYLNGDNECILRHNPTGFQFERCPASQRVWRQRAWIGMLNTTCNERLRS